MKASAKMELESIKSELNAIIREMDDISSGLKRDFVGIGCEQCARCVDRVNEQYRLVKTKLENMNTTQVNAGVAKAEGAR